MPHDPRLSNLYRHTRIAGPSPDLDGAIRTEAQRFARGRRYRWLLPLSSAALVLFGLSLVLRIIELDRPPEQPALSEMEAVELERAAAPSPKRTQPETPASLRPVPAVKETPAAAVDQTLRMREEVTVPAHKFERKTRPAPFLDQEAAIGGMAPLPLTGKRKSDPAATAESPDERKDDPDAWLRRIRKLVSVGRMSDAAGQLAELRASYPEHPLPDDLSVLLEP